MDSKQKQSLSKKTYTWEKRADEEVWGNGKFETVEECVEEAKKTGYFEPGETIYIGECEDVQIRVNLSDILERIESDVYEQVGEVSEGWGISFVDEKRRGIYEIYEERVQRLVEEYIKEIGETPGFYRVTNIFSRVVN